MLECLGKVKSHRSKLAEGCFSREREVSSAGTRLKWHVDCGATCGSEQKLAGVRISVKKLAQCTRFGLQLLLQ